MINYNRTKQFGIGSITCDNDTITLTTNTNYYPYYWKAFDLSSKNAEIDKYIINENATILFWNDGTKTISKRHKEDKFDKELGFLFAYFYKKYKGSKASRKRVINCIDYKKIKTFLFEFYVNDIGEDDYNKAKRYLSNLKVDKK